MSFMTKLGRGLAAFGTGFANELPGALNRQMAIQQQRKQDTRYSEGVARDERDREIQRIRNRASSDPQGAIQEFLSKGYTDEAASLQAETTGAERTALQAASGGLETAVAGATAASSTLDLSTPELRTAAIGTLGQQ